MLSDIVINEEQIKAKEMAKDFLNNNYYDFWKKSKNTNNRNINDNCIVENVTNMWYYHYEKLFNSVPSKCDLNFDDKMIVNTVEIMEAISNLPCNKSSGFDNIIAAHIIDADLHISANLFNI